MTLVSDILRLLGTRKPLKSGGAGLDDLRQEVRAGLSFSAFEAVLGTLSLSREEAYAALRLPRRTFARRKREGKLSPEESEKLVRLARIAARAATVLGNDKKAGSWLKRKNRALGNQDPLSLLDTEIGASQVEAVLGRIEHGIAS